MLKAIFFDAFGTLFQVEKGFSARILIDHIRSFGKEIHESEFHAAWKNYYQTQTTDNQPFKTEREIFADRNAFLCDMYNVPVNAQMMAQQQLSVAMQRLPYPDVEAVLSHLKGRYQLFIASNTDNDIIDAVLQKNSITFDGVFTSENLQCYKPSPTFYKNLLKAIRLSPYETLFVGDSPAEDVIAPMQAGMHAVRLDRSGTNFSLPFLSSLFDLLAFIETIP